MEKHFENTIEVPKWKKIPVTVEVEGRKENVWVNYLIEEKPMEGICIECGKENQTMSCESVKEVRVETNNKEAIDQATEKIKELVKKHEEKMFICKDCFNDDFLEKRKGLYIKALEEAQEELGIEVDKKAQRESVLGANKE